MDAKDTIAQVEAEDGSLDVNEFARHVESYMNDGYECLGAPFFHPDLGHGLFQAVIRKGTD